MRGAVWLLLASAECLQVSMERGALDRRDLLRIGLASSASLLPFAPSATAASGGSAAALVTDEATLEFVQQVSAEETQVLRVRLGLFGDDAPESVRIFKQLLEGTLRAPCRRDESSDDEMVARSALTKKGVYKQCDAGAERPVSLAQSQVWRIVQGKRIDAGAVKGVFAMRLPPSTPPDEALRLSHDAPGLLSVRRGGGSFDFGLMPAAAPELDDAYVVIGRALDAESLATISAMDVLPVVKAADIFGQREGSDKSRAKACAYGSANSYCSQLKPLKKLTLVRASVKTLK